MWKNHVKAYPEWSVNCTWSSPPKLQHLSNVNSLYFAPADKNEISCLSGDYSRKMKNIQSLTMND